MPESNQKKTGKSEIPKENIWDDSRSFAIQKNYLPDGRRFVSEMWGESGYTFLTYRFPILGIESLSKKQVVDYLKTQGITIDLNKYPLKKIQLLTNFYDSDQYDLTLMIGESDE